MVEDKGTQLLEVFQEMKNMTPVFSCWSPTATTTYTPNVYYSSLERESEKLQRMIGLENKRKLSKKTLKRGEC